MRSGRRQPAQCHHQRSICAWGPAGRAVDVRAPQRQPDASARSRPTARGRAVGSHPSQSRSCRHQHDAGGCSRTLRGTRRIGRNCRLPSRRANDPRAVRPLGRDRRCNDERAKSRRLDAPSPTTSALLRYPARSVGQSAATSSKLDAMSARMAWLRGVTLARPERAAVPVKEEARLLAALRARDGKRARILRSSPANGRRSSGGGPRGARN